MINLSELKEIKKINRFLKEKIILKLIFTTYYNKKLNDLYKVLCEAELEAFKRKAEYLKKLEKAHKRKYFSIKNKLLISIKRIFGFQKEKALLFNDNGELVKSVNILPTENEFIFDNKTYTIIREDVTTKVKIARVIEDETLYFYNVNNITPITLTAPVTSVALKAKVLHAIMESKHLINLNKPKGALAGLMEGNMKWILIGGAGILAYILFGGGAK